MSVCVCVCICLSVCACVLCLCAECTFVCVHVLLHVLMHGCTLFYMEGMNGCKYDVYTDNYKLQYVCMYESLRVWCVSIYVSGCAYLHLHA